MGEHEDMQETLHRIETKLDLLTKALGFRVVACCKDDYHSLTSRRERLLAEEARVAQYKCPTCDDWSGAPYITKILTP